MNERVERLTCVKTNRLIRRAKHPADCLSAPRGLLLTIPPPLALASPYPHLAVMSEVDVKGGIVAESAPASVSAVGSTALLSTESSKTSSLFREIACEIDRGFDQGPSTTDNSLFRP